MASNADDMIFSAELYPHRSLSRFGYRNLGLLLAALTIIHAIFFVVVGAWLVMIFWGLDLILLAGALWVNQRRARAREYVEVTSQAITIRKVSASGETSRYNFNPFSAKLEVHRRGDFGIEKIEISEPGQMTDVGSFLNPDDRESFAKSFNAAMIKAKRLYWR